MKVVFMQRVPAPLGGPEKKGRRVTLSLRGVYIHHMDALVEQGVYMDHQETIRAGLMLLLQKHGVELYTEKGGLVPRL